MTYNLTAIGHNTTGIFTFIQSVDNILMFGWFGTLTLLAIFIILVSSFYYTTGDIRKAFMASGLICTILSILLKALGLISDLTLFIVIVLSAVSLAFSFIGDR